jgi:hypothetical protein
MALVNKIATSACRNYRHPLHGVIPFLIFLFTYYFISFSFIYRVRVHISTQSYVTNNYHISARYTLIIARIIYIFEKWLSRTIPVVNRISDVYVCTLCVQCRTKEKLGPVLNKLWAPSISPEGGRPGMPTQTDRHTCSENLGIVKILRYIRSAMCTAPATNSKLLYITQSPNPPKTVLHRSHDGIIKLDKKRTDRTVTTVNIM